MKYAERINKLPPYLFAAIEELKAKKRKEGVDLIPLGIGDPDLPTPNFIIDVLVKEARNPKNHQYPTSQGEEWFRQAVARWYKNRFRVTLDPETQAMNLIGAKEGISNITRAFVNAGETVLVPDPGYPVYANGSTILIDAVPFAMPLYEKNGFKPVFSDIPSPILKKARFMFLNYPNNPTAAVADRAFLKEAVDFANEHNIIICYDNAYSEFSFGDYTSPSILQVQGGENHIEIHSCSKTFCMTGHRVGFAVGNPDLIAGLKKVKSQIDSGCPMYIQRAACAGLDSYTSQKKPKEVQAFMDEYKKRRDVLVDGLNRIGLPCKKPDATFYVWVKCPGSSMEFTKKVLETGVVITPGIGFGKYGEGYVRFALTQPINRIKEAIERMRGVI